MAAVTEEELEEIRQKNADLREALEEERQKASAAVHDRSRDLQAEELSAENVRLEAQLEAAKKQTEALAGEEASNNEAVMARLQDLQDNPPTPPGVAVEPVQSEEGSDESSDQSGSNDSTGGVS